MLRQLESTSEMMASALASVQSGLGKLQGSSDATSQPLGNAERHYLLEALTDFASVSGTLMHCVMVVHSALHVQAHAQHSSPLPLSGLAAGGFVQSVLRLLEAPGLGGPCPEWSTVSELVGSAQLSSDALIAASHATIVHFEQRLLQCITVSTAKAVGVTTGGGSFKRTREGAARHATPAPTPVLCRRVDLQLNAAGGMLAGFCHALPLLQGELTLGGATYILFFYINNTQLAPLDPSPQLLPQVQPGALELKKLSTTA